MSIYDEIKQERQRQDEKWGGPRHDDQHSIEEWHMFILQYSCRCLVANSEGNIGLAKHRLIQIAALAVAAVESLDRKMSRKVGED